MPQMSPMLWLNIMLISFLMIFSINCLIFSSIKMKNIKISSKMKDNHWMW